MVNSSWTIHRAKLRQPRHGDGLVRRPRLTATLDRALHVPLTLLAAPAGFGKTTLLAEWATRQATPTAWLTVDETDRDLTQFVVHVVTAIETIVPAIGEPILTLLQRPHPVPAAEIGASLADELLEVDHDVVLVIDDYHRAAAADVEAFLGGLLPLLPPVFHLVLATRADPTLPLSRLRLQHQVHELRAADLRFTEMETRELLAFAGLPDAEPALVTTLLEQTEGWVAVLRLASRVAPAISDRDRLAAAVRRNQHLMNFLAEEVLATSSEDAQEFMLRTAIVERVCASLADALLEPAPPAGSGALLERLVREQIPLEPTGDDAGWFRYHPLFRNLLLHQLALRRTPTVLADLHGRAGAWYATHDLVDEALHHLLAAGDTSGAARLVEDQVSPALARDNWTALAGWLRRLPREVVYARPALLLATAFTCYRTGHMASLRAVLGEVETLLARGELDAATTEAMRAEVDLLSLATLMPFDQDPAAALAVARRGLERISPERRLAHGIAQVGVGLGLQATGDTAAAVSWLTACAEGHAGRIDAATLRVLQGLLWVHRMAGNIPQCEAIAHDLIAVSRRHDLPLAPGWAHLYLAWQAYEADDLAAAIDHYLAVLAGARHAIFFCRFEAMLGLAIAYEGQGMVFEADHTMQRLREIVLGEDVLEHLPNVQAGEARLALLRGQTADAIRWLSAPGIDLDSAFLHLPEHPLMTRVTVLLAEGSAESLALAWSAVEALRARAESSHHHLALIKIQALAALVLAAQGKTDAALRELRQSLDGAATVGMRRTYRDLGPAMLALLRELAASSAWDPRHDHLLRTLVPPESGGEETRALAVSGAAPPIAEVLTEREADVLLGLTRRLSYQEIADELFISLNTVKSHAISIYRKLDVPNRRQALRKAHALGWSAHP